MDADLCVSIHLLPVPPGANTQTVRPNETAPLGKNCRIKPFLAIKARSRNRHRNKLTVAIYSLLHYETPSQAAGEAAGTPSPSGSSLCPAGQGQLEARQPSIAVTPHHYVIPTLQPAAARCSRHERKLFGWGDASSPSCVNELRMNHLFLNNPKHNEGWKHLLFLKMNHFSHFSVLLITQTAGCAKCKAKGCAGTCG